MPTAKEKTDEKYMADYIKGILEKNGYMGTSVKIFKNKENYLARLQELQKNLGGERNTEQEQKMADVIKAISI